MNFKELHQQKNPLLIANVWDVPSVKVAEESGFNAIATSSAAIASVFGYNDGEELTFTELEYMVKCIIRNTKLPLSVDIESGYSENPEIVASNIRKLVKLGVVGINIEDSIVKNNIRSLVNSVKFTNQLLEIKKLLNEEDIDIFINVRIDTFLLQISDTINETKKRMDLYSNADINGFFIPCIEEEYAIQELVNYTNLPINVMCMPNLPNFEVLQNLGVKRISMGNFLFDRMYTHLQEIEKNIIADQSFQSIF